MKIIAFAASSSHHSINKKLTAYAAGLLPENSTVELLDLNDYEMPLYSQDRENELGIPTAAHSFYTTIQQSDGVIISFAEHNGSFTAAYKNLFDWCSRITPKVYENKPLVLLSTSPGPGGGNSVLSQATHSIPFFGGTVVAAVSLPSFYSNFDRETQRVTDKQLASQISDAIHQLADHAMPHD